MKAKVFGHLTPSQPIFFSHRQCRDSRFFKLVINTKVNILEFSTTLRTIAAAIMKDNAVFRLTNLTMPVMFRLEAFALLVTGNFCPALGEWHP